jgi:EAL domain-containing protein (putative c-di-GMP-specific phosphodiesterase class I)
MAHQPELADLQRKIAIDLFLDLDDHALRSNRQQGLVCSFLGLNLSSAFQPIIRADGKIVGREALLRAVVIAKEEAISPRSAFAHAIAAQKLVAFDRLVRTIHLLNHANEFGEHELIFLNVHPQLLTSVSDHGRTFEQILHFYSVPTSRVVIEIRESAVKDDARLEEAVKNYRNLGYKIAIDNFGSGHTSRDDLFQPEQEQLKSGVRESQSWLDRVLSLQPDIVKFDESVLRKAQRSTEAVFALHRLVSLFHDIGTKVAVQNIETNGQLEIARSVGADLLQGHYLGRPQLLSEARGKLCRNERLAA